MPKEELAIKQGRRAAVVLALGALYGFLYLPVINVVAESLRGRTGGPSLEWYRGLLETPDLLQAVGTSLAVAGTSACLALALGTSLALAFRTQVRFTRPLRLLGSLPLIFPEIVLGVGLMLLFGRSLSPLAARLGFPLGPFPAVVAGHTSLGLAYVLVVVEARLRRLDPGLMEVAASLGATPWQTFRRVTLPLLRPGLLAGGLLAFVVSLDDFYVSFFSTAGGSGLLTLPLYLYALQAKAGVTPELHAASSVLLAVSLGLLALVFLRRESRAALWSVHS